MKFPIVRRLLRQPTFTAVTILILAVGMAANTAIFAVIEGVLLKPLPFTDSEELVDINHSAPGVNFTKAGSAPFLYFAYGEESRTLQDVGLWRGDTASLTGLGDPADVPALNVTDEVLTALQVRPILGRPFSKGDMVSGGPDTVIVSYGFWKSKFGGDSHVIGRGIILDGKPREIIGVLPPSFRFLSQNPQLLIPLQLDRAKTFLGNFSYNSLARLKPGITLAQANVDLARIIPVALDRFPPFPGYSKKMFEEARLSPALEPLKQSVIGDVGTVLWVLMGTVGIVLLIACANVINLMFVRAQGRQHELAIRTAIGAGRWQVARDLMLESLTVGVMGGIVGLGLAWAALRLLLFLAPANLPRLDEISLDMRTVLFNLALSLLAGSLFGAVLAIRYGAPKVNLALRAGGRSMSSSREHHRARNTLVVVQIALALMLLLSSGLMIRTFRNLRQVDPGYRDPNHLQIFGLYIPPAAVKDATQVVRMQQQVLDKIAALPGVTDVAMGTSIPMGGNHWRDAIFAEDHAYAEGQIAPLRRFKIVSPGYSKALGARLIAGRDLTWTDIYDKRPFALVSENLARELWDDPRSAVGKRIRESLKAPWREVIGVVNDVRDDGVDQPAPASVLFPLYMDNFTGDSLFVQRGISYLVRSNRAGTSTFTDEISRAVWAVDSNLPLASVQTAGDLYDKSMARTSFTLVMLSIAAATALLLGIAGIYGVVSYSVSQRTREVGIRMALGARNSHVTGMFVQQAAWLALVGIAFGLAASLVLVRLMSGLLFNVTPTDPLTYIGVSLLLAIAAMIASYIPALRATTLSPTEALRID